MPSSRRSFPLSIFLVFLVITGILGFLAYAGMMEKSLTAASRVGTSYSSGSAAMFYGLVYYTAILILWLWACAYSRYKHLLRLGLVVAWLLSVAAYAVYFL
jgi:hypothetical protein